MASTNLAAVDTSVPEIWSHRLCGSYIKNSFWQKFVGGNDGMAPIIQDTSLEGGPGDVVHIAIVSRLTGNGVSGETQLVGAEEVLPITDQALTVSLFRHGVRSNHPAIHRSAIDVAAEAKRQLGIWMAGQFDSKRYAAYANPTGASVAYLGGRSSIGTVVAGDKWTVAELVNVKRQLIEAGCTPLVTRSGAEYHGIVLRARQIQDLMGDSAFATNVTNANPRGDSNPYLSGVVGAVAGMLVYSDQGVTTANDGGSSAKVARNIAFGAGFGVEAISERPKVVFDDADYGFEQGWGLMAQAAFARSAVAKQHLVVYGASAS